MNFTKTLSFFLLLAGALPLRAQTYWQQEVDTHIDVRLDDKTHFLHGYETFTYINHAPDTLKYIYIHLWPNAYKNDRTAFAEQKGENGDTKFYFSKPSERGYIDSLKFMINGNEEDYYHADNTPDVVRIDLREPLVPGGRLEVSTPFRVKIPIVFSRLGHTGRAYFISQWFPKPAVYDQKGWHPLPYLDQGEFYSNIGSYDVSITLPQNYIVMATGNCSDDAENAWLDSLSRKPLPPDTLYAKSWPRSSEELKTLHFHEDNIHDFAWFADKRWVVRKDTVTVPGTGNVVTAYAAFLPGHQKYWSKATGYLRSTVQYYSSFAGPYAYRTIKAVEGDMSAGGGMEYPTVTIIDRQAATTDLRTVVVHEAGHNWFYGMLASNERDYAWMDEGINSFYERKTVHALKGYTKKEVTLSSDLLDDVAYYEQAAIREDQQLDQTSANFTSLNYGADVYYKTRLMIGWLESYMGKEAFSAGMHDYFNTWKFKHPYPEDFRAIMQKHTDKHIDWFFDGALQTDQPVDFKLTGVSGRNGATTVLVRNQSDFAAPVGLLAIRGDSIISNTWTEPFTGTTSVALPAEAAGWTKIKVTGAIPDVKTSNNFYRRKGLFHRGGAKLAGFAGISRSDKEKIYILPAIGYNQYDGFQLGLLFHDLTWPETRFHYAIAPTYGFTGNKPTGAASIGYSWYPKHTFHEILLQLDAKTYHYNQTDVNIANTLVARYIKAAPSLSFVFREKDARSPVKRTLTLKAYSISEDYFDFKQDPSDSLYKPSVKQQQKYYGLVRYFHNNTRTYNPFSYTLEGQLGADFAKITAEGNFRVDYHKKNKALHVRAFAGKFFTINNDAFAAERYYLNTTYTGVNDYLYDDTYVGRSERDGFAGKQISIREGGFKIPTLFQNPIIGRTDNWLVTLNLKTDLPLGKLPVRLYLDAGTFADAANKNPSGNKFLYEGGVEIYTPFYNILSVYIPLVMSQDFSDYLKSVYGDKRFGKSIVFSLNLQNINWLKAPSKALHMMGDM